MLVHSLQIFSTDQEVAELGTTWQLSLLIRICAMFFI
jgi:hypothetical protein